MQSHDSSSFQFALLENLIQLKCGCTQISHMETESYLYPSTLAGYLSTTTFELNKIFEQWQVCQIMLNAVTATTADTLQGLINGNTQ